MFKPKNYGKDLARVFLDIFSLPENESRIHFPEKNLDLLLENLLFFAVQHCSTNTTQYSKLKEVAPKGCHKISSMIRSKAHLCETQCI